jgi:hypothetical protein
MPLSDLQLVQRLMRALLEGRGVNNKRNLIRLGGFINIYQQAWSYVYTHDVVRMSITVLSFKDLAYQRSKKGSHRSWYISM